MLEGSFIIIQANEHEILLREDTGMMATGTIFRITPHEDQGFAFLKIEELKPKEVK